MAYQKDKDLVQISVNNDMPICQIIEYNKFRFMHDKKLKEIRRKQKNNVIKEVRLRPRIAVHDLEVKTKLIKDFLREGHKVRIAVMFKGREMVFVNQGREILETLKNNFSAIGKFEAEPKLEGCCLRVTVVPIR